MGRTPSLWWVPSGHEQLSCAGSSFCPKRTLPKCSNGSESSGLESFLRLPDNVCKQLCRMHMQTHTCTPRDERYLALSDVTARGSDAWK